MMTIVPRRHCLMLLLLLAGCASAVTMRFDCSDTKCARVTVDRIYGAELPEGGGYIHGLASTETLVVESGVGGADDVSKLDVAGVRGDLVPDGDGSVFRLTIPCGPRAEWREVLQLSDGQIQRLESFGALAAERSESPRKGGVEGFIAQEYSFVVQLPGEIIESRLQGRELPPDWQIRSVACSSRLEIPFTAAECEIKEVVWEVRCAAPGVQVPNAPGGSIGGKSSWRIK